MFCNTYKFIAESAKKNPIFGIIFHVIRDYKQVLYENVCEVLRSYKDLNKKGMLKKKVRNICMCLAKNEIEKKVKKIH